MRVQSEEPLHVCRGLRPALALGAALLVPFVAGCHPRVAPPVVLTAPPGADPAAVEAWRRLNDLRARGGLPPVVLDLELSAACRKHAEYLALNRNSDAVRGLRAHEEDASLPGYTPEGARAGGLADIHWGGTPTSAVNDWLATLYHRIPMLQPNLERVGFGAFERISVLAFERSERSWGDWPVAHPFPDQEEVPLVFSLIGEYPEPRPQGFPERTGFPITLSFTPGLAVEVTRAELREEDGAQVEHALSTPSSPAISFPQSAVCLLPRKPLRPRTSYRVELEGTVGGEPRSWSWSFRTIEAVAPALDALESFAGLEGRHVRVQGRVRSVCECNLGKWDLYVGDRERTRVIAQVPKARLDELMKAGFPEPLALETELVELEGIVGVLGDPRTGWIVLDEPRQLRVLDEDVPFADVNDQAALETGTGEVRRWRGVSGRPFQISRLGPATYVPLSAGGRQVYVELWEDAARALTARHGDLAGLEGRSVEVRGVLRKDWPFVGSWSVGVRHPSRIVVGAPSPRTVQ